MTELDRIKALNKAILEDKEIEKLLEQKRKILNNLTPKYLIDKEKNTATAILDKKQAELLDSIDFSINHRMEQIKSFYQH